MTVVLWITLPGAWFTLGYLAGAASLRNWVREFPTLSIDTGDIVFAAAMFLFGPIGALSMLMCGAYSWQGKPKKHRGRMGFVETWARRREGVA